MSAVIVGSLLGGISAGAAQAVGEPVNGFPNWAERVVHEWANRARVDPTIEMAACGTSCVEAACYHAMQPLLWSEALNRSARFHSDEMAKQAYFAHDSACTVVSNISALYPTSCDGSASCACVGGTKTCSTDGCTAWFDRIARFGASAGGEIIATPSDPNSAFYLWLYETGDTASCTFTQKNGHRWLLLTSTGGFGAGMSSRATGDFGSGGTASKIPSGTHYPQQAASVGMWANWYDAAGPSLAAVNIDGVCTPMNLQRGTQTNGAWSATLTGFGSGCHRYFFSFRDANGAAVTFPSTGSLAIGSGAACPDWSATRPADCVLGGPTPTDSPTVPPTSSATVTATRTATASRTPTASATGTRSATPTQSRTPTRTALASATPSASPTATTAPSGNDISGSVRYYSNDLAVPGVNVSTGAQSIATTDATGRYSLANVPQINVTVTPQGTGGSAGAISALDASYVLQAVAGLRQLSAEQVLACDVTGNGNVSTLDAAQILQYAVDLVPSFSVASACGSDWLFVPDPAAAPNQTLVQPEVGPTGCTLGSIAYGAVTTSLDGQDFRAILFGDCTGNWHPAGSASSARAAAAPVVRVGAWRALRGDRLALPIGIERRIPAHAIELRLAYDSGALAFAHAQLVGRASGALLAVNSALPGELRVAIAAGDPILADGKPLLLVVFDAPTGGRAAVPQVSTRLDDD